MKKKILSVMAVMTLLISTCSVAVAANSKDGATRDNLKSYGSIEYHNGNDVVVINAEDLYMLADQIDQVKLDVVDQLEAMNTYFTAGSGIALSTDKDISIAHSQPSRSDTIDPLSVNFDTMLEGIAASQSVSTDVTAYGYSPGTKLYKSADGSLITNGSEAGEGATQITVSAATAENLSAGAVAWVNGELILGTGEDNKSYFKKVNNEDLTDVFSDLSQIGNNNIAGFKGELPYTFTPNKSLLLVFDGGHDPSFTGKNFPDVIFRGNNFTICYWEKNKYEKINIIVQDSIQNTTKLLMKEW